MIYEMAGILARRWGNVWDMNAACIVASAMDETSSEMYSKSL